MNILITGSGLVGSYAARANLQRGDGVTLFDRCADTIYSTAVVGQPVCTTAGDIRDVGAVSAVLQQQRIEAIIHTAGAMKGSFQDDRFDSYATNTYGALCVAEAARAAGVKRLVLCSSLAVYDFSVPADTITEDHPLAPESLYDHSKLLAESILRPYCLEVELELIILRFAGIYGVGQFRSGAWMGQKIHGLITAARDGEAVLIDENEIGTNEYLYVEDAARALAAACHIEVVRPETINIGAGGLSSAHELGRAIAKICPGSNVCYSTSESADRPAYLRRTAPLSIAKAGQLLDYQPQYAKIEDGVRDYLQEFERLNLDDQEAGDAIAG